MARWVQAPMQDAIWPCKCTLLRHAYSLCCSLKRFCLCVPRALSFEVTHMRKNFVHDLCCSLKRFCLCVPRALSFEVAHMRKNFVHDLHACILSCFALHQPQDDGRHRTEYDATLSFRERTDREERAGDRRYGGNGPNLRAPLRLAVLVCSQRGRFMQTVSFVRDEARGSL